MNEEHRYRCEVRYVCSLGEKATAFLAEVEKKRGKPAADKLREDARGQYALGNRGRAGDWRERNPVAMAAQGSEPERQKALDAARQRCKSLQDDLFRHGQGR